MRARNNLSTKINLINLFRELWEEHIMWTRSFIISTVSELDDIEYVTHRLLRNPTDFANVFRLYYGDEIGMAGGEDPDCRRCMEWRQSEWDLEMLAYYRALIKLRREKSVFSGGKFAQLLADGEHGVYVFARWDAAGTALCMFNFSDHPVLVATNEFLPQSNVPEVLQGRLRGAGELAEVLAGTYQLCFPLEADGGQAADSAAVSCRIIDSDDHTCSIRLEPLCAAVLERVS